MVKPPIIVFAEGDANIYISVEEAERLMESPEVFEGIYTVYDSEGYLLDLYVDEIYRPFASIPLPKWLSVLLKVPIFSPETLVSLLALIGILHLQNLGVPVGPVKILGRKERQPREPELRDKLVDYLRRISERPGPDTVQIDENWLNTATLPELITKARHPRT